MWYNNPCSHGLFVEVCDKATNYISIFTTQLSQLSKISRYLAIFTKSNCLMYKCSKNTVYCDKSTSIKLCINDDDYHDKGDPLKHGIRNNGVSEFQFYTFFITESHSSLNS